MTELGRNILALAVGWIAFAGTATADYWTFDWAWSRIQDLVHLVHGVAILDSLVGILIAPFIFFFVLLLFILPVFVGGWARDGAYLTLGGALNNCIYPEIGRAAALCSN